MKKLSLIVAIIGLIACVALVADSVILAINANLSILHSVLVISFTSVMATFVAELMLEIVREYK